MIAIGTQYETDGGRAVNGSCAILTALVRHSRAHEVAERKTRAQRERELVECKREVSHLRPRVETLERTSKAAGGLDS